MSSGGLRAGLRHVETLAASYRDGDVALIQTPYMAQRLSQIEIDIDALEMTELRIMSSLQTGQNPGAVSSSLAKLRTSELKQAITALAVDVIGADALVWETRRPLYDVNDPLLLDDDAVTAVPEHLNSRAFTIFGGTSEVQRDIIAKVVIGM